MTHGEKYKLHGERIEVLTKSTLTYELEGCSAKPLQHVDLLGTSFDSGHDGVAELINISSAVELFW